MSRIGRQFPMEWALGHVFLGRPGGEVDRRGNDPSRARQGRPRIRRIRRLTYGALRVPAPADFVAPASPLVVSADTLAEYAGKYASGSSTSAHDLQADHPRLGFEKLDVENGVFNVSRMTDGGLAMKAGVMAGDLIVQPYDLKVDSSSLDAADALLEAHDVPSLR